MNEMDCSRSSHDSFFYYSSALTCFKQERARDTVTQRKEQMLLKQTMQKTKKFFLKSLQNLKNLLFCSYENIPRTLFLNPFTCTSISKEPIYPEFSSSNQSSPLSHVQNNADDCTMKHIISIDADDHCTEKGVITTSCELSGEMKHKVEKTSRKIQPADSTTDSFRYAADNGTGDYMLPQKMKEFEMMDVGDVAHTLDVEEALHYYSRLTCPEYVDMVNKFFIDMYTDFNVIPQPSITKSSSSRRLGPLTPQSSIRISSASKRLESALSRQASIRISSSSRRLDSGLTPQPSIRINSSSRRLGPLTLCLD